MRAIAEFIMRGRMQAALVAFCGNLVPLISPAAVALVGLRRGWHEGFLVALWALLPSLLALYISDLNALVIAASVTGLMMVLVAAEVLRVSVSWRYALVVIAVGSGTVVLLLSGLFGSELTSLQQAMTKVIAQMQQGQKQQAAVNFMPSETFIVGLIGYIVALNAVLALVVARWWQSTLFNPGGFRAEFHQLRLGTREAMLLAAGIIFCQFSSAEYFSWSELLGLPLLLSGIALVHFTVANRQMGGHWLVIFYVGLILIAPLSLGLVVLGFIDSFLNIRPRIAGNTGRQG